MLVKIDPKILMLDASENTYVGTKGIKRITGRA
jgi:hypothetical protein